MSKSGALAAVYFLVLLLTVALAKSRGVDGMGVFLFAFSLLGFGVNSHMAMRGEP